MKLLTKLEKSKEVWFLVVISFVFFLLRLPSLFEPLWYGDEGIYEVIGIGLNQGRLLYQGIWDNKPPLLYLIYAIFHSDQPVIRFISLLFGIASVFFFYFLSKSLFPKPSTKYITTSIFAVLFAIPLLEGNIANAENFMIPLALGAALLVINVYKLQTINYKLIIVGLLLGLSFLIKIVALFDIAAFTLFLVFSQIKQLEMKDIKKVIVELLPMYIGFVLPLVITLIYFALQHALPEFIRSAFLSNVGYVNYGNQLHLLGMQVPQGFLLLKLILLGAFCIIMLRKRKVISPSTQFVLLWIAFSVFSALFSQRPYTHYLLVLLSSFCLAIGILLQRTKSQILFVGAFFLLTLYFLTNFSFYTKNVGYYQNFLAFITNNKDITSYRAFFDGSTPRDYAIADFLNSKLTAKDQIFLWGNNAQLYALVNKIPPGRYIVSYWIGSTDQTKKETLTALQKVNPRFIVVMPNAGPMPYSLKGYAQRLSINNAIIYEKSF